MTSTIHGRRAALALLALLACAPPAAAQVGTVAPLPYPGWVPADGVAPTLSVEVSYGHVPGMWRYRYTLANGAGAAQDIWQLGFRLGGWVAQVGTPAGWFPIADTEATYDPAGPGIPGVEFLADIPDTSPGDFYPPSPHQVPPGSSLPGFEFHSPYPPGYVRAWAQGYAPVPFPPDPERGDTIEPNPVPHDTLNAQRLTTIGPFTYTGVVTRGNLNVDTGEGFLGFMNLAVSGAVLRAPAPVALKLSVGGETVFPETFRALLNGVDVTAQFHPGTAGGADLAALFALGALPLREGDNVLVTTIEGLLPGTTRRAIDEDVIQFRVVP
ncbi:MAG TPA: hypothetical protein VHG08_15355 [Longimicrobium sp.]|nr:hypothetical protein [Longimicrobium sp.]